MMTLTTRMCQRRGFIHLCSRTASFSRDSTRKIVNATETGIEETEPVKRNPSSSKALTPLKQARTIKNLHKENKALFGVLLETKHEKVKRTRKELKLVKKLTIPTTSEKKRVSKQKAMGSENESSEKINDEVDRTLDLILRDEKKRARELLKLGSLPRASSVRLEHAGVSINKNRIKLDVVQDNMMGKSSPVTTVRAHKGAEIEWALKNAPTKIKLIELSPSSSSTSDRDGVEGGGGADGVDNAHQPVDEQGHNSTLARPWSLPNEKNEHKRAGVGAPATQKTIRPPSTGTSYPHTNQKKVFEQRDHQYLSPVPSSEQETDLSLPTVEQLINSFYETDNGQLRPRSETRKMVLSATKSFSSSKHDHAADVEGNNKNYPHYENAQEEKLGGMDFNEQSQQKESRKTDDDHHQIRNEPQIGAAAQVSSTNSSIFIPYYNPDRNYASSSDAGSVGTEDYVKYVNDPSEKNITESINSTVKLITSFPYPFTFSTKSHHEQQAGKTPASSPLPPESKSGGVLPNEFLNPENNGTDNKMIMNSEAHQLPLLSPQSSVKLPSVSKILNATMPKEQAEALRRWEERMIAQMGVQGFRQYKENILTNGKTFHSNIECYLRGTPPEEISVAEPNQGHWNSLNAVLASVDHVHVLESHVIHPKLQYCGMIDCVAEFRNRLVLIDWKTSQKPKPFVSMTYDTPLQIAAYIGAINYDERYSLKIDDGLIVVAYEDGSSCQTFLLSSMDVEKYWKIWLKRLQHFRRMNAPL